MRVYIEQVLGYHKMKYYVKTILKTKGDMQMRARQNQRTCNAFTPWVNQQQKEIYTL